MITINGEDLDDGVDEAESIPVIEEDWLNVEWLYRFTERLGILCADAKPTPEQSAMAAQEANEAVMRLEEE